MDKDITISKFKELINLTEINQLDDLLKKFKDDKRDGIQKLIKSSKNKIAAYEKEILRMKEIQKFEQSCYNKGYKLVGGVDEVGRGPLAGPVVTACVILPQGLVIEGINDSKKIPEKKREELYSIIMEKALSVSFGIVDNNVIDEINIYKATKQAMEVAINTANVTPDYLLIDAMKLPNIKIPQESIIKGDERSISIGAASIVAKVHRDNLMKLYSEIYNEYDFGQNKGYGTKNHIDAIKKNGICPIHRKSFLTNI